MKGGVVDGEIKYVKGWEGNAAEEMKYFSFK